MRGVRKVRMRQAKGSREKGGERRGRVISDLK
jgi:hypothetical protein